jgi:dihydrofolate reductase/thymidylate synthase
MQCSEAMNSPLCDAIHVTEIDSSFQCDTFMPAVDTNLFRVWSASFPAVENGIRFSFVTYVRNESISRPSPPSGGKDGVSRLLGNEESPLPNIKDMAAVAASCTVQKLPRFIQETHEEYQYLNLIQDYQQRPDWWLELTSKAMELDNSWDKSAGEYLSLYQSVRVR